MLMTLQLLLMFGNLSVGGKRIKMNLEPEQFSLPENFTGVLPIFPVTGTVFFPKTLLPLHIFEPRYRKMLADCIVGEKLIGIVYSTVDKSSTVSVHRVGTIGKIAVAERLPTGESNIVLSGVERFFLSENPELKDYLVARITVFPEMLPSSGDPVMYAQLKRLMELVGESGVLDLGDLEIPAGGGALAFQYHSLINALCSVAGVPLHSKQKWLELQSVNERYRNILPVVSQIIESENLLKEVSHMAPDKDKIGLN